MLFTSTSFAASRSGTCERSTGPPSCARVAEPELVAQRARAPRGGARSSSASVRGRTRQPHVEPAVEEAAERAQDDLEPLRRRVAAEREQPEARRSWAGVAARELLEVDPVADRVHLARVEREGTAVDARDLARRERVAARSVGLACQCVYQSTTRHPDRPGERRRRAPRRSGTCARRRRSGLGSSSRASAASKRRPRPTLRRSRNSRTRAFVGSAPSDRAVGEHDHLVDVRRESADLRHRRGECGCAGSTCCVTNTSWRIRSSPCRRA